MPCHSAVPHLDLVLVTVVNQLLILIFFCVMAMRQTFLSVTEQLVVHVNISMMQVSFAVKSQIKAITKF